jgi:hypothetical protein
MSKAMASISFPFWLITQRRDLISMPVEPDGMPGEVAAFAATTFMVERGETGWEFKMISRSTLAGLLNDLRLVGKKGLCMNPTNDGGKKVEFDSLDGFVT